jgi:hypothetical protein
VEGEGGEVGERGGGAGRQDGGGGSFERGLGWAADGVDAFVDAVKLAGGDTPSDRVVRKTSIEELSPRDVSVLPGGDAGDNGVFGDIWRHAVEIPRGP